MSPSAQPDRKIVPMPARPGPAPKERDPRIDFFRGVALMMILINHMPGNPWEAITNRELGFSDAAEAFFVMSGIAAGIAYSPAIARWLDGKGGLRAALTPMWRRAWTLYLVQILLTVIALGLFAWAADTFLLSKFRTMHNLGLIYSDTRAALTGIPILGYQIGYVNILPTYIVLMMAGPLILAAAIRWPWQTLTASVALWWVAGAYRLNIPNHPGGGGWFLSPLSWQLIFLVGLMIGHRHRRGERMVPVNRTLFYAALFFVVFAFAWRHVPALGSFMNHKMAQLSSLGAPYHITTHNKTLLAAPRLLHVLAMLYVLSCLPVVRSIAAHTASAPLRLLGQHGLLVFAIGTVLALIGQILMDVEPNVAWLPWMLPPLAALISYAAVRIAIWGTVPRSPTPDRAATVSAAPMRDLA